MTDPTWLPAALIGLLSLLCGMALGGVLIKRGNFKATFDLLQKKLETYESLQRMDDRQLTQVSGQRDAAIAERDAARARVARLEGMLADCEIGKADAEGELARLRGGP